MASKTFTVSIPETHLGAVTDAATAMGIPVAQYLRIAGIEKANREREKVRHEG